MWATYRVAIVSTVLAGTFKALDMGRSSRFSFGMTAFLLIDSVSRHQWGSLKFHDGLSAVHFLLSTASAWIWECSTLTITDIITKSFHTSCWSGETSPLPHPPLCPTLRGGVGTPQVTRPPTYNLTPICHLTIYYTKVPSKFLSFRVTSSLPIWSWHGSRQI